MASNDTLEVGYWSIRGLGAPLRMMCEYAGVPYSAKCYDVEEKEGGGWDLTSWFSAKTELKKANPLINLPYLKDGDLVIAQTNACLSYLGVKFGLMGSTPLERVKVDELLCEGMDLRNSMVKEFYGGTSEGLSALLSHSSLGKLEASLVAGAEGPYFLGEKPCAADFFVAEHFAQLVVLAVHVNACMPSHPRLHQLLVTLETEPALARYYSSALSKLPINNKMAIFGAVPGGGKWQSGQDYDWGKVTNDTPTNAAFCFLKPHAVTDAVVGLLRGYLAGRGIKVLESGVIEAADIDSKMLIDQHYYAIASKATILKPAQLQVPVDKFRAQFGLDWAEALESGKVFNAIDACAEFGCEASELDAAWGEAKRSKKLVKFGGGFYCGLVDLNEKSLYVFNGFFMSMRAKFTKPGTSIRYFSVEWPKHKLDWSDFRGKCLGPTDPADAPRDSLRGLLDEAWAELGLATQPNVGDNGVHASASPLEALAERSNWLGSAVSSDPFGRLLIAAGVSEEQIKAWSLDPLVKTDPNTDVTSSLFDFVEDTDTDECLAKLMTVAACN